jgi:hypothetical protein
VYTWFDAANCAGQGGIFWVYTRAYSRLCRESTGWDGKWRIRRRFGAGGRVTRRSSSYGATGKSVTCHDLLATSGPFQDPRWGHLNGANLSNTPTPARHAPGAGNYVTDNPSKLGNYVTADSFRGICGFIDVVHQLGATQPSRRKPYAARLFIRD